MRNHLIVVLVLASACGGGDRVSNDSNPACSETVHSRLEALDHDLAPGSSGDGVRAVQEYLIIGDAIGRM